MTESMSDLQAALSDIHAHAERYEGAGMGAEAARIRADGMKAIMDAQRDAAACKAVFGAKWAASRSKGVDASTVEVIERLLGSNKRVEFSIDDPKVRDLVPVLNRARVRATLVAVHKIIADVKASESRVVFQRSVEAAAGASTSGISRATASRPKPVLKRTEHTYRPPSFHERIVDYLTDEVPANIWLWGPTGCGKTHYVYYLGEVLGRHVYRLNCHEGMDKASFFGDKTIAIDEKSLQNFIKFAEGVVIKSMTHGLDEQGQEVDEPSILYIDEAGAMPTRIAIALNRVLETMSKRREALLEEDGGRIVRSHSGWRVICGANTAGKGLTGFGDAGFTTQAEAIDASVLDRMTYTFRFGYSKSAEMAILREKIGDDRVVNMVIQFRDAIRGYIKQGELRSPFSTRALIALADSYRVCGDLPTAIYDVFFGKLEPEEVPVYNEQANVVFGVDILSTVQDDDMDYM